MPRLRAAAPLPALSTPVVPEESSPFWWLRYIPMVVAVVLLLQLCYTAGRVALIPLLASFALAYVLNPLVVAFEKRGAKRAIAALCALLVVAACIALFLIFVVPDLWNQSVSAGTKIMAAFTPANARAQREALHQFSPTLDGIIGARLQHFLSSPNSLMSTTRTLFAGSATNLFATALESLDLLVVPFFVFYILVDFGDWRVNAEDLIPPRFRDTFSRLFDEIGRILQSYVLGQLLIAMMMGVLYAVGFVLIKVPAWAGIATLAGFLNVIPYVGTLSGLLLASGFTYAQTGSIWRLAGVLGIFIAVQCIEGYYLTPRILGERLSLHPMAVFLGLLVGGKLFGLLGILLAVPSIAVAQVFVKMFRELYRGSHFYHQGEISPSRIPSPVMEERLAQAADSVLKEQVDEQKGNELLTVKKADDDRVARR